MPSHFLSDIYLHHSHLSYILMMESQAKDPSYSLINDTGNQFGKGLAELLTEPEELIAAKVRRHPHTPTYSSERVCVMGDAAQAMSPMPRAGAGQGLEDALVLSTLLAQPNLRKIDVPAALEAYTRLRQPRRSMIAERASQLSIVSLGRIKAGLDVAELAAAPEGKWDFAQSGGFDFDLTKVAALTKFESGRKSQESEL